MTTDPGTGEDPAVDHALVRAAEEAVAAYARGDDHTVAAAARTADGRIVTGLNVHHFTGGPCAELVVMGAAAAQGAYDLRQIVAVADGGRGVLPPCGRCRQVLLDYHPDLTVIVGAGDDRRALPVRALLPVAYVAAEQQDGAEGGPATAAPGQPSGSQE
ncbi:cytidine deaminase family protein [Streptomyces niger]|uniref:cytidine deaminase family protein n=1 Tax=Streptomyces niger TaxID=66373 RepID=UPI00069C47AC|nr:cytidine deaminase [Streptomyces niger]